VKWVFFAARHSPCFTVLKEHLTLGVHPLPDGESEEEEEESLKLLTDLLLKGGTRPEPEPDIVAQRWRKVLWSAPGFSLGFDCSNVA